MKQTVFVPTLVDHANLNSQVNNVRSILSSWSASVATVRSLTYGDPDPAVVANPYVKVRRLWRRRAWYLHLFLQYMRRADVIFYPGCHFVDTAGLRWRKRLGRRAVLVETFEGLLGDAAREKEYSAVAGHRVYCQMVDDAVLARMDTHYEMADRIIAISPFLARMGSSRFGDKFSVLPLGIDSGCFYFEPREENRRLRVVSAGHLSAHKRPEVFVQLARQYPCADFIWYGDGNACQSLRSASQSEGLKNITFQGAVSRKDLADAFRSADIFVMPSMSEGVPKVTQESAACGCAQVVFGFYEAPSVIDGVNGFVVWDDQQFADRVGELIHDRSLTARFGNTGAEMAIALWDWKKVALQWEHAVCELL